MQYLSKEIEALAKKRKQSGNSLVRKGISCGVFQEYDQGEFQGPSKKSTEA